MFYIDHEFTKFTIFIHPKFINQAYTFCTHERERDFIAFMYLCGYAYYRGCAKLCAVEDAWEMKRAFF